MSPSCPITLHPPALPSSYIVYLLYFQSPNEGSAVIDSVGLAVWSENVFNLQRIGNHIRPYLRLLARRVLLSDWARFFFSILSLNGVWVPCHSLL